MELNQWLDTQLGQDIWNKKYRFENENFEEWLDRISGGNEDIKKLIIEKKFLFGGRILANRGLQHKGKKIVYQNCFTIPSPEDNIESIFDTAKHMARIYSRGGGVGIGIHKLSPKGAKLNNAADETTGAVSFMKLYSLVTELIGAKGRRGALIITINDTHPDLLDFINIKNDLEQVTKANISIKISSDFMEAVINNKEWKLSFTREETGQTIEKVVNAKELFRLICQNNWNMAEPGILLWDNIQNYNLLSENPYFIYGNVNPCVIGETLILTKSGNKQIKDCINQEIEIWNGYEWSLVKPVETGKNQQVMKVEFSDGESLICTPYHQFVLSDNKRIECKDLSIGDKLIKHKLPVIEGIKSMHNPYTQGFFSGDGFNCNDRPTKYIAFYDEKIDLIKFCNVINKRGSTYNSETWSVDVIYDKLFVPDAKYTIKDRLLWLAGIIDSDGTNMGEHSGISISSIERDFLIRIKYMLIEMGVFSCIGLMKKATSKLMPDGKGGQKEYKCKDCYRITISSYELYKLIDLGLLLNRVKISKKPHRSAKRLTTIKNITVLDTKHDVYCFTDSKNNSGVFNGIVTGQCGELPLPEGFSRNNHYIWGGSCNLGSMNISNYVIDGVLDLEQLFIDTKIAFKAMNEVLFESIELLPYEELKQSVRDWRINGMGHMGIADALILMGVKYGSKESCNIAEAVQRTILNACVEASVEDVEKYGTYKYYDYKYLEHNQFFLDKISDPIKDKIKQFGLANGAFCTIAPTGTLSTMLGISGGGEPIFNFSYNRETQSLHGKSYFYKVFTKITQDFMDQHGITNEDNLPEYFITSQNIPYKDRIKFQSSLQFYNDGAISSTINLPNTATIEDIEEIYIYGYKSKLKGLTIYRDGCKRTGILTTDDIIEDEEELDTELPRGFIEEVPDGLTYRKYKLKTGCSNLYFFVGIDESENKIYDCFTNTDSVGGCMINTIANSRLLSAGLRGGVPVEYLIQQLNKSGSCPSYQKTRGQRAGALKIKDMALEYIPEDVLQMINSYIGEPLSEGKSCASAIGNVLKNIVKEFNDAEDLETMEYETVTNEEIKKIGNINGCPECGESLKHEGGCITCICGYSLCG